ncbi:hypothetical protein BRD00_10275 [Halobacteriales archaeon QS_8_69_26]|nr:MAG: hypothetical protein BRD00_10275 [Halobacteriales archaeon QS_8_69_26]
MSSDTSSRVYRLHSTLELPLEDVHEFFDTADFPEPIDDVEITRRNNTLIFQAAAADESISKYTPTAQLKASVTENRVYEDGHEPEARGSRGWALEEEEEEIESELVEYAAFKGDRETVLQNSTLQYEMYLVLVEIAKNAEKGTLTAITEVDGSLVATRIVDGEERPATIEVVEGPSDAAADSEGVDWRNNEFISD